MKLYYSAGACSLGAHIVLMESGLPFQAVKADIRNKLVTDDGVDYTKLNPVGYVPTLTLDDGTVLTEFAAIVQYVADQVPEKHLAPPNGTMDRYRLQSWLSFVATEIHKTVFSIVFNAAMPEGAKKIALQKAGPRLAFIDAALSRNEYLLGRTFSVPDAYCFAAMRWAAPTGLDLAPYPHIGAFMSRMRARPAVQEALRVEAAELTESDRGRWYDKYRD